MRERQLANACGYDVVDCSKFVPRVDARLGFVGRSSHDEPPEPKPATQHDLLQVHEVRTLKNAHGAQRHKPRTAALVTLLQRDPVKVVAH